MEGDSLVEEWAGDESMTNHYATAVIRDGVLYGYHGRQEYGPSLRAVDLATGQVRWTEDRFGAGSLILAGGRLVILRESGELMLAEASPEGYQLAAEGWAAWAADKFSDGAQAEAGRVALVLNSPQTPFWLPRPLGGNSGDGFKLEVFGPWGQSLGWF